jgi:hypothetical protein
MTWVPGTKNLLEPELRRARVLSSQGGKQEGGRDQGRRVKGDRWKVAVSSGWEQEICFSPSSFYICDLGFNSDVLSTCSA